MAANKPTVVDKFLNRRQSNPAGEMSFVDHIEELRWHIVRALVAIIVCAIMVFVNIEWVFTNIILGPAQSDFISYRALCSLGHTLHIEALCLNNMQIEFQNTELSGQFMMSFSVSFMLGFIVAFPYVFWEFWRFVKPALKEQESRSARGIVFWCSFLFLVGVAFAYFLVAPFTINFFANYQLSPQFKNIITIANYYDTMSDLILGMGIVFELPVVIYFISKAGILTPEILRKQQRFAILVIFVLAAVITPPDWFSIWLVAIPLIALYQIGIAISARVVKQKKQKPFFD